MVVASTKASTPITVHEYMLRDEDEVRAELIDGEIVVSPEPTPFHQQISARLIGVLQEEARKRQIGSWFPPINLVLSPHKLFQPDLSFFTADNKPELTEPMVNALPSIVIEILSPSTRARDLITKRALYADFGVGEYWIVDPDSESISINLRDEQGIYVEATMESDRVQIGIFAGTLIDRGWIFEH
jgi:Uma2 family endonuclease